MSAQPTTSPFTFLAWKEDDMALVAGTADKELGYIALMEIDGIDADDVVQYAKDANGEENWQKDIAKRFPEYVQALGAQQGKETFVTTGKAVVEFSDLNTGEVLSDSFPATAESYNEAVRIEEARADHSVSYKNNHDGEDDGDYEDMDDDEEDEEEESPESRAYMRRRHLLDMLSTQLETAISIGNELGLSGLEVEAAYQDAVGAAHPLPKSAEECALLAAKDPALSAYLQSTQSGGMGGMPEGMPPGAAGCPQQ